MVDCSRRILKSKNCFDRDSALSALWMPDREGAKMTGLGLSLDSVLRGEIFIGDNSPTTSSSFCNKVVSDVQGYNIQQELERFASSKESKANDLVQRNKTEQ